MRQFIEVEVQKNGRAVKFVFNVNQIINVGEKSMITTAIYPIGQGKVGQVVYDLGTEEAERVKKVLLGTEK